MMRRNLRLLCAITLLVFAPRIIVAIDTYNDGPMAFIYIAFALATFAYLAIATVIEALEEAK